MADATWLFYVRRKLRRVLDGYYRARYRFTARLAGKRDIAADLDRPGLLVIQIDGLSYDALREAAERGRIPHIRKLLDAGAFSLRQWYCGLPSNTPAVQAALMFGDNDNIPGFRWYERSMGNYISFRNPFDAQAVERRLKERHGGLLADGSSYANLLSGGAMTSVLTMSSVTDLSMGRTLR